MGLLSDFYVATVAEARAVGADAVPACVFPSAQMKGLTELELALLGELLLRRPWQELLDSAKALGFTSDADQGPWVWGFPEELVAALAALDSQTIGEAATRWAAGEEMTANRFDQESSREVIEELVRLARLSLEQNRRLWLWTSL